jgi:hypothetical protein
LVVEAWESKTIRPEGGHGLPAYPDVSLVPRDRPGDFTTIAHLDPNPFCRLARAYGAGFCNVARCSQPDPQLAWPCAGSEVIMSVGVRLAVLILAYLAQSEEYPVEVRPAAAQPRSTRHGTAKPWVRDDLAHIILIDPHRVHDYRPTAQGTPHASPIPHQRRGHWRHLRAECFHTPRKIWIRPTWVGPAVWKARGQIYRVLTDRVSQGDGKGNLSA